MTVYFIRSGDSGPVKIGYTTNVKSRLSALQTSHHETLHLVRTIEGTRYFERKLHSLYAQHRLAGEWFNLSDQQVTADFSAIEQSTDCEVATTDAVPPKWMRFDEPLRQIMASVGGATKLARAIGISHCAVCQWKRVPATSLAAVARASGIPAAQIRPDLLGDQQQAAA